MSTLNVTNVTTANGTTDLAMSTGNTLNTGVILTANAGYVLVGYAASQGAYRLQVTGGAGLAGATAWTNLSDERLKTNIVKITDGLEKISQLNPVDYIFINEEEHPDVRERGGFLAQDVLHVFPEMVTKDASPTGKDKELVDEDGKAYDLTLTNKFHAYVVAAIQDLKKELDDLKKQIAAQSR